MNRLRNRYRFVILNDKNFEEKASFSLRGIRVITVVSILFVLMFSIMFSLIAFTPIREYIPGYADIETRKRLHDLVIRTDSLEYQLAVKNQYLVNLRNILTGNVQDSFQNYKRPQNVQTAHSTDKMFAKSEADSLLRDEFENQDPYELRFQEVSTSKNNIANLAFFTPVQGLITEGYDLKTGHHAVDVVASANVGVKSVLNGVVIFADWTVNTGYVVMVQHENNLISIYKHNSVLLKKVGNFVKAGEVLAIIGESGELSTGPHLHFELWYDGTPLNPEEYISF